jgi:hypothetical protein
MAPKNPKDKEQIGRASEPGLFLVSDRTLSWEWTPFRDDIRSQLASGWANQVKQYQGQEVA